MKLEPPTHAVESGPEEAPPVVAVKGPPGGALMNLRAVQLVPVRK